MDRRAGRGLGTFFPSIASDPHPSAVPRQNISVAAGLSSRHSRLIDHMATYQLSVNGQLHEIDVAPEMPLLWTLRDSLGLRGTKFGCGRGICGACTVLVDGAAMRSCITPIASVARQRITT